MNPSAQETRAQGMPGAQCARSLVCKKNKHTSVVTTVTPERPGIPRAMVYGLLRALPGDHACLTPSPALLLADLTPGIGASEPHDLAVRVSTVRYTLPPASTASRPTSVTCATPPLRDGTVRDIKVIWGWGQAKFRQIRIFNGISRLPRKPRILRALELKRPYTGNPFAFANSFNDASGRAPMCWITSAAASAPSRPAFS
jgi:hypothetical protein